MLKVESAECQEKTKTYILSYTYTLFEEDIYSAPSQDCYQKLTFICFYAVVFG